jgi:uncharacterized protein (TIGR02117 family)
MKRLKKPIKHTIKSTGIFLETFFAFLVFYLIFSLTGGAIPTGDTPKNGDIYIYVRSNGVHTDLCLPTQTEQMDWSNFIPTKDYGQECDKDFIGIGWGDKGFFLDTPTWAELKFSTAFKAAFLPTPTAMHVEYMPEPMKSETVKKVYISKMKYLKLVKYVKESFVRIKHQVDVIEGKGYSPADNFYEAHKSYHMFRTCNRWTNEALKTINIKTGVFALFPGGIMDHLPN